MLKMILLLIWMTSVSASDFSGKDSMNDISFKDYENFPKNWELVTIRFRKDTGEMRLTYGNKLAVNTLKSGSINYPDGAVFAKTSVHTGSDPQFESSLVPKGIRRYQLMVKNKKKYSESGGWGYGLFDDKGKTFPEEPKMTQQACYACHTIVENRGGIFSRPFDFIKNTKFMATNFPTTRSLHFEWIELSKLPNHISALVGKTVTRTRIVINEKLSKNVFQGTLDELKPLLEEESKKSKSPALFMAADKVRFVLIIPKKSDDCIGMGSFEIISTDINLKPIIETICTND